MDNNVQNQQKSLCFYLQTNAIFIFLHYTSTFYTSRTIGDRENVYLFTFLGEKKIQNYRRDQRPDEYET